MTGRRVPPVLVALWAVDLACVGTGTGGDASSCPAGDSQADSAVSFVADILPLFNSKGCLATGCHGGLFPVSGYRLDTYNASFGPGDEARALGACNVVPGDPASSYLIEKLGPGPRSGEQMPLVGEPLNDDEVELLATWIRDGAPEN